MLRAVVPLMRSERFGGCIVGELVARALRRARRYRLSRRRSWLVPGLAAVLGPLDDLAKPSTRLRGVNTIGIGGPAPGGRCPPTRRNAGAPLPLVFARLRH